ncbi:MAG: VWA domain-containing protein [Cyanobacteria bacterium SZAS-4]|nr:VWA domain-containing protein [Cyanobacteria bacterium SZAS-4]
MSVPSTHTSGKNRRNRGQALSILIVFLAAFVIAPLSLFSFEVARYQLAKKQLKACIDSCALAAGATVASSNNTDTSVTQQASIATAIDMFKRNSILDQPLTGTTQSTVLPLAPGAKQATLFFQFLEPVTRQPVQIGNPSGKIIQITGAFGLVPMFADFLGWRGVYPVVETANGGLPMLDVVLCFDISASMDDFTPISIINRYKLNSISNGYKIIGQGNLYPTFHCTGPTGTALNATFPQSLDSNDGGYNFSASDRGINSGAAAPNKLSANVTDVVVNIDGTSSFSSGTTVTSGGTAYFFPANNLGCLVEAARGNLESVSVATKANVPYSAWGITPKAGYYQAYLQAAFSQRHPIGDAIAAAQNFFTVMNNDCDAHFGLVTFGSSVGAAKNSTCASDLGYGSIGSITDNPGAYKSNGFPADPLSPNPPNPAISLDPTLGPAYSNYADVTAATSPLIAYGGTNISGALDAAIDQLKSAGQGGRGLGRKGAVKTIVLFTDGLPTVSSFGGDPTQDARAQAKIANQSGIPIYCIGLCMVPSLQDTQTQVLTDLNSDPAAGGIAGISGNGAQFYQATEASQLNLVFENVARSLVQLVR